MDLKMKLISIAQRKKQWMAHEIFHPKSILAADWSVKRAQIHKWFHMSFASLSFHRRGNKMFWNVKSGKVELCAISQWMSTVNWHVLLVPVEFRLLHTSSRYHKYHSHFLIRLFFASCISIRSTNSTRARVMWFTLSKFPQRRRRTSQNSEMTYANAIWHKWHGFWFVDFNSRFVQCTRCCMNNLLHVVCRWTTYAMRNDKWIEKKVSSNRIWIWRIFLSISAANIRNHNHMKNVLHNSLWNHRLSSNYCIIALGQALSFNWRAFRLLHCLLTMLETHLLFVPKPKSFDNIVIFLKGSNSSYAIRSIHFEVSYGWNGALNCNKFI